MANTITFTASERFAFALLAVVLIVHPGFIKTSTALAIEEVIAETTPVLEAVVIAEPGPTVKEVKLTTITAYASVPWQTDSTPFITADGSRVRDGIVAANFLPFGTQVRIPELFGDKVFEVHDRMNRRYTNRMDIWMESTAKSRQFGIHRQVKIEILEKTKTTAP
ncbi:MAG: hypothetical protein Q8P82_00260 [bacterium]|nr:hypothetical protein [bacterium]